MSNDDETQIMFRPHVTPDSNGHFIASQMIGNKLYSVHGSSAMNATTTLLLSMPTIERMHRETRKRPIA